MTEPLHPPSGVKEGGPSSSNRDVGARQRAEKSTHDPALVPDLQTWLTDVVKATKGFRVYADNNEMLLKFMDRAFVGLEFLLARDPELTLSIREDRILYGKEIVHVSADRQDGLPFVLYRNAFRRLVFVAGMTRQELSGLLRAVATDYSSYDQVGEDLVTTLWRLQLPHVRYLTIDALSRFKAEDDDREEIERIEADIENIVAAIYRTSAAEDDLVAGVSISKEDLEALREVRAEDPEDLEMLDHATERAITEVPEGQLKRVQADLQEESKEELTRRILNILVEILFRETSGEQSAITIDLIQQLFDAMVLARRYRDAIEMITRLRDHAESAGDMQQMHVARHLLGLFATESRVLPVLSTLNEQHYAVSNSELLEFLRALGPPISAILVRALDSLTSPAHRRALCDLVIELGVPSLAHLAECANNAKWFVVRDILGLAQQYDIADAGPLVAMGLSHEHPKVRYVAVGMLRGYARGAADQSLARMFHDDDLDVRLGAYRVAAARRSRDVLPSLELIMSGEKFAQREVRELRLMMAAYAAIAGTTGIPLLGKILNAGFFASLTHTDVQVAAAYALASIGMEATPTLQRGARTLNPKVREACKRVLSREHKRRETQAELLRGRLPGASGSVQDASSTADDGEGKSVSLDLEFMLEPGVTDPLAEAPPYRIDIPLKDVAPEETVVERARPSLPRSDGPSNHRDEMPVNLPPPPSRDLPGAAPGEIPLSQGRTAPLSPHSIDMVTGPLPPAPVSAPSTLSEPPPVVGYDASALSPDAVDPDAYAAPPQAQRAAAGAGRPRCIRGSAAQQHPRPPPALGGPDAYAAPPAQPYPNVPGPDAYAAPAAQQHPNAPPPALGGPDAYAAPPAQPYPNVPGPDAYAAPAAQQHPNAPPPALGGPDAYAAPPAQPYPNLPPPLTDRPMPKTGSVPLEPHMLTGAVSQSGEWPALPPEAIPPIPSDDHSQGAPPMPPDDPRAAQAALQEHPLSSSSAPAAPPFAGQSPWAKHPSPGQSVARSGVEFPPPLPADPFEPLGSPPSGGYGGGTPLLGDDFAPAHPLVPSNPASVEPVAPPAPLPQPRMPSSEPVAQAGAQPLMPSSFVTPPPPPDNPMSQPAGLPSFPFVASEAPAESSKPEPVTDLLQLSPPPKAKQPASLPVDPDWPRKWAAEEAARVRSVDAPPPEREVGDAAESPDARVRPPRPAVDPGDSGAWPPPPPDLGWSDPDDEDEAGASDSNPSRPPPLAPSVRAPGGPASLVPPRPVPVAPSMQSSGELRSSVPPRPTPVAPSMQSSVDPASSVPPRPAPVAPSMRAPGDPASSVPPRPVPVAPSMRAPGDPASSVPPRPVPVAPSMQSSGEPTSSVPPRPVPVAPSVRAPGDAASSVPPRPAPVAPSMQSSGELRSSVPPRPAPVAPSMQSSGELRSSVPPRPAPVAPSMPPSGEPTSSVPPRPVPVAPSVRAPGGPAFSVPRAVPVAPSMQSSGEPMSSVPSRPAPVAPSMQSSGEPMSLVPPRPAPVAPSMPPSGGPASSVPPRPAPVAPSMQRPPPASAPPFRSSPPARDTRPTPVSDVGWSPTPTPEELAALDDAPDLPETRVLTGDLENSAPRMPAVSALHPGEIPPPRFPPPSESPPKMGWTRNAPPPRMPPPRRPDDGPMSDAARASGPALGPSGPAAAPSVEDGFETSDKARPDSRAATTPGDAVPAALPPAAKPEIPGLVDDLQLEDEPPGRG